MTRWDRPPRLHDFIESYYKSMAGVAEPAFGDGSGLHEMIADLDWPVYRQGVLALDPAREEARLRRNIEKVEALFGFELQGEAVLFGAFTAMDGYARFDRGTHRVFMGVDEGHGRGEYLDILETHELTHVARESRPSIWSGWGLDVGMSHDSFVEDQPVIEHLFGEGFSCAVSEILVPSEDRWHYAYQVREDLERILAHGDAVDRVVHAELRAGSGSDWGRLYSPSSYRPKLPVFTHYVWAWQWAKKLIREAGQGDPKRILEVCSRDWQEHALAFRLSEVS